MYRKVIGFFSASTRKSLSKERFRCPINSREGLQPPSLLLHTDDVTNHLLFEKEMFLRRQDHTTRRPIHGTPLVVRNIDQACQQLRLRVRLLFRMSDLLAINYSNWHQYDQRNLAIDGKRSMLQSATRYWQILWRLINQGWKMASKNLVF